MLLILTKGNSTKTKRILLLLNYLYADITHYNFILQKYYIIQCKNNKQINDKYFELRWMSKRPFISMTSIISVDLVKNNIINSAISFILFLCIPSLVRSLLCIIKCLFLKQGKKLFSANAEMKMIYKTKFYKSLLQIELAK